MQGPSRLSDAKSNYFLLENSSTLKKLKKKLVLIGGFLKPSIFAIRELEIPATIDPQKSSVILLHISMNFDKNISGVLTDDVVLPFVNF